MAQSPLDNFVENRIIIADEIAQRFIPRKRLQELVRDPLGRRYRRHRNVDDLSSSVAEDYQAIEKLEADRWRG